MQDDDQEGKDINIRALVTWRLVVLKLKTTVMVDNLYKSTSGPPAITRGRSHGHDEPKKKPHLQIQLKRANSPMSFLLRESVILKVKELYKRKQYLK